MILLAPQTRPGPTNNVSTVSVLASKEMEWFSPAPLVFPEASRYAMAMFQPSPAKNGISQNKENPRTQKQIKYHVSGLNHLISDFARSVSAGSPRRCFPAVTQSAAPGVFFTC